MKKSKSAQKTNVMRVLDKNKIEYKEHYYTPSGELSGVEVASELGENVDQAFKTLVTVAKSREHYVFVIPVNESLDLKKASKSVGEKNIEMIKAKELLGLTGYVHGGCSPIGMKKEFKTVIHSTAKDYDKIFVSAGKVGAQVEVALEDLKKIVNIDLADVIK